MARQDSSLLNLLVECPWWVNVLVSGFAYVFLRFIFPSIIFSGMAANAFIKGLSGAAPFVALVLLLPAPIAILNSWLKKRRSNAWQPKEHRVAGERKVRVRKDTSVARLQRSTKGVK